LSVPIEDRGYVFGDGVYETMRTYGGRVWALDRHMRRLERSLREVAITTAPLDDIRRWIAAGMNQCALQGAVVYVQVTRGVAPRQHTFSADIIPTVMLTFRQFTPVSEDQRRLGVSAITVPDIRWGRRDIKSTNLLPNVLAKQQAHEAGAFEAILVEADGCVTEGSSTNVFAVVEGVLRTHPADYLYRGGVPRDLVICCAEKHGMRIDETSFSLEDLRGAREVFLSGTTTEVLGITRLDGRQVGNGEVGPITAALYASLEACVREGCDGV